MGSAFRFMDLLEEKSHMEDTRYVITECEIKTYINKIICRYSDETARARLTNFKKCMYFCSYGHHNPMFLQKIQNELSIPAELIHIYELLYLVLSDKKHEFLKFLPSECSMSGYKTASFSWHVPYIFMPLLTSYILASFAYKPDEHSIAHFFELANKYFDRALNESTEYLQGFHMEDLRDISLDLSNEYLGRQYFSTLNIIYKTYCKNVDQRQLMKSSVDGLTHILLDCPSHPSPIPAYANELLKHFEKQLYSITHKYPTDSIDLIALYPHQEPFSLVKEENIMAELSDGLSNIVNALLNFINRYLDNNSISDSIYKLSIQNYDVFYDDYCLLLISLEQKPTEAENELIAYFDLVHNDPTIMTAVKNGTLHISQPYENLHIQNFTKLINTVSMDLITYFKKFLRMVKYASLPNPEMHNDLIVDHPYLSNLNNDVSRVLINFEKKKKDFFKNLPATLYFNKSGYLHQIKYPNFNFQVMDIIKIISILKNISCNLSSDYLINYLHSQGIRFPLKRPDVIIFLLNFNQIMEDFD